ncbi:MAG TPA: family 43 glycosylhydrolase, partial [Burkholderiales bacterium]|nr:family 43 glycosylhydrolase [Burkholderiales bacterium]
EYASLIEAPWVVLRKGTYYLFYSGDRCCGRKPHYAVMVARSDKALGPYERLSDPQRNGSHAILGGHDTWIAPGHCSVISDDGGDEWILYHAARSSEAGNPTRARLMLLDRIDYRDGWPRVEGDQPSAATRESPQIAHNAAR